MVVVVVILELQGADGKQQGAHADNEREYDRDNAFGSFHGMILRLCSFMFWYLDDKGREEQ
jgi:hypothetical protein